MNVNICLRWKTGEKLICGLISVFVEGRFLHLNVGGRSERDSDGGVCLCFEEDRE